MSVARSTLITKGAHIGMHVTDVVPVGAATQSGREVTEARATVLSVAAVPGSLSAHPQWSAVPQGREVTRSVHQLPR